MLLDCGLGDDKLGGDLPCSRRSDERVRAEGRLTQRGDHIELAPGQFGRNAAAGVGLGQHVLAGQSSDPAALRAERQHVAVLQQALGGELAVDSGAVPG